MKTQKIVPLNNHNIQNCGCAECNTIKGITHKAAISFEGTNIYTTNGTVVTVPSEINEILANIGVVLKDRTMQRLSDKEINERLAEIDVAILANIVSYTSTSVISNFTLTLQNIYEVFLHRLTIELNNIDFDLPFRFGDLFSSNVRDLNTDLSLNDTMFDIVTKYISLSPIDRIDSESSLIDYSATYVNICGTYIYHDIKKEIDKIIALYLGENEDQFIRNVYDIFNRLYRLMMGDMSFEITLFVNNMIASSGLFISREQLSQILLSI